MNMEARRIPSVLRRVRFVSIAAGAGMASPASAAPLPASVFPPAYATVTWASASLLLPVTERRSALSLSKESGATGERRRRAPEGVPRGAKARPPRRRDRVTKWELCRPRRLSHRIMRSAVERDNQDERDLARKHLPMDWVRVRGPGIGAWSSPYSNTCEML